LSTGDYSLPQANLFAVLRDILFVNGQIHNAGRFQHLDLESSVHITNLVFSICVTPAPCTWAKRRIWSSAGVVTPLTKPNTSTPVGWGPSLACVN
jgi:hypothetical protein